MNGSNELRRAGTVRQSSMAISRMLCGPRCCSFIKPATNKMSFRTKKPTEHKINDEETAKHVTDDNTRMALLRGQVVLKKRDRQEQNRQSRLRVHHQHQCDTNAHTRARNDAVTRETNYNKKQSAFRLNAKKHKKQRRQRVNTEPTLLRTTRC